MSRVLEGCDIKNVWEKIRQWFEDFVAGYGVNIMVNGLFEKGEFPKNATFTRRTGTIGYPT